MLITVIDYGSGNLRSATKAFEKASAGMSHVRVLLTNKADDVRKADRVVLPGQGAFADCMKGLSSVPGMLDALHEVVIQKARPFFGICVGMQLLATRGLEHGTHAGLNWLAGEVRALEPGTADLKIPHMGWNTLQPSKANHPLFHHMAAAPYFYFVHSYALYLENRADELAACDYGGPFTAAVIKNNIIGTQFHPEKSQKTGLQLIQNFLEWRP